MGKQKVLFLLLKLLVSGYGLYWLLAQLDPRAFFQLTRQMGAGVLLTAVIVHLLSYAMGYFRWSWLMRRAGSQVACRDQIAGYLLGVFFNQFLPTGVGGDVARTLRLMFHGHTSVPLIASAAADRLYGLLAVLLLGSVALFMAPDVPYHTESAWLFLIGWLALLLLIGVMMGSMRWKHRYTRSWSAVLAPLLALLSSPRNLLLGLLYSLANQALVLWVFLWLASALGLVIPTATLLSIVLTVFLLANIPVSLGGLGVREGALAALLMSADVDAGLATALPLLYLGVLWMASLPGLAGWFVRPEHQRL